MKTIIAFFFIAFLASSIFAQGVQGWYQQSSGTGQSLSLLTFVNRDTGYAGAFYTTNAGNTWLPYLQPVNVVQFIDSLHGWGGSSKGSGWISATTNGGLTWNDYNTGFDAAGSLFFCNALRGYCDEVTGGEERIGRTTDGGKTWTPYPTLLGTFGVGANTNFFACFDSLHAMVGTVDYQDPNPPNKIGAGVFYTSDGGINWKFAMKSIQENVAYFPFAAFDTSTVYFIGGDSPRVYSSNNRGYTLGSFALPNGGFTGTEVCTSGYASDRNNITIVGSSGLIFRSYDGQTWVKQNSGTTAVLYAVTFVDSTTGWVVGAGGTILHTTNAGKAWVRQYLPLPIEVRVVPEPFATKTTLSYSIPKAAKVDVKLYDMLGKEVYHIESNGIQSEGEHSIEISGENLPGGVYYFILTAGSFNGMGKVTKIVP